MKRLQLLFVALALVATCFAKSYPWEYKKSYEVEVVRVAQQGTKFYKVFGGWLHVRDKTNKKPPFFAFASGLSA